MIRVFAYSKDKNNCQNTNKHNLFFLDAFRFNLKPSVEMKKLLQYGEAKVKPFLPLMQAPLIKIKAQFLLWQRFCQNHSDVVVSKRAYNLCQPDIFLAVKILLSNLAILSAFFAAAKRSFSKLRQIKSDLRTTMGHVRLDCLFLIYIHNNISFSTGAISKKFAATNRKIKP